MLNRGTVTSLSRVSFSGDGEPSAWPKRQENECAEAPCLHRHFFDSHLCGEKLDLIPSPL